jgi:hypothetical protein
MTRSAVYREGVIPLPRPWLLTSAMLVGVAAGLLAGLASALFLDINLRPEAVVGLVVGVPGVLGTLVVLLSGRRWMTTLGVLVLSVAPGWIGALVALRAVSGG